MAAPPPTPPEVPASQAPPPAQPQEKQVVTSPSPQQRVPPETEEAVVRQVEWYLGRTNLERDYFLKQRMDQDFWVSLEVILSFPKMRQHGISDPAVVANVLARLSANIDVDTARNRIRPAWAKRSFLALTAVPQGTPVAAVEALFTKTPGTPQPLSVSPFPDKEGMWQVVFDNPDDARIALDKVKDLTIGSSSPPVKVTAHVFPAFDQSTFAHGTFAAPPGMSGPVSPGAQSIGSAYYDGTGPPNVNVASMASAYVAAGVPPGMMGPVMGGMGIATHGGPNAGGYGYVPGGVYPGGNAYSTASYIPANQRGSFTGGTPPYYINSYGGQSQYDPTLSQQATTGSTNGGSQRSTAEMEERRVAAAAAAAAAAAGALAGNVNVGGVGSKTSATSAESNGPHSGGSRQRRQSQRQGPHFHQNGATGIGTNQTRYQGLVGGDPARTSLQQPSPRGSGGADAIGAAGRGQGHTQHGGNGPARKPGNPGNGGAPVPGEGQRISKGQGGVSGEGASLRPNSVGKKNKKRSNMNRQGLGTNSGSGGDNKGGHEVDGGREDGKKGGDGQKAGEKGSRSEPNLTAMYFPPLPGSVEGSAPKSMPRPASGALGASQNSIAAVVAGTAVKPVQRSGDASQNSDPKQSQVGMKKDVVETATAAEPESRTPATTKPPETGDISRDRAVRSTEKSMPADVDVGGTLGGDKAAAVSDVASNVSSSSGGTVGNGTSPGGASAGSGEEKAPGEGPVATGNNTGMSYAAILRAKAKKPLPPPVSLAPSSSDTSSGEASGASTGSTDQGSSQQASSTSGGDGAGSGSRQISSKSADAKKDGHVKSRSKPSTPASADGTGRSQSVTPGGDAASAKPSFSPSAPRSVWANKPQSVLQATAVVKPPLVKIPSAATGGTGTTPSSTVSATVGTSKHIDELPATSNPVSSNGPSSKCEASGTPDVSSSSGESPSVASGSAASTTPAASSKPVKAHSVPSKGVSSTAAVPAASEGSTAKPALMNGGGSTGVTPKGAWGQGAAKILSKKESLATDKLSSKTGLDP